MNAAVAVSGTIRAGIERQHLKFDNEADWLEARKQDITSTEASALFGLSPYDTEFELWHKKSGNVIAAPFEPSERMRWGNRLQDAIAAGIAEDMGLQIKPLSGYYSRILPVRLGASFDYEIVSHVDGPGVLEIKKVDELIFRQQWCADDGAEEAPKHIEIQHQTQLEARDYGWGMIGVLIGGNRVKVLRRQRDREMGLAIRERVAMFWESIEAGVAPKPDLAKDAEFIAKLYGFADPGKVYDGRGDSELSDLVLEYAAAAEAGKVAEEAKKRAKSALLMKIGDHERAIGPSGWSISAGMVAGGTVSYERQPYRNFRVTQTKTKGA